MKTSVAPLHFGETVCEVAELAAAPGSTPSSGAGTSMCRPGNAQAARAARTVRGKTGSPYPLMARITGQVQRRISVPCWKLRFHLDAV